MSTIRCPLSGVDVRCPGVGVRAFRVRVRGVCTGDFVERVGAAQAGTFGPGSFVWFPEGMLVEHGATEDCDVTTLFITNKPFDIHCAFEESIAPGSLGPGEGVPHVGHPHRGQDAVGHQCRDSAGDRS
jgi:hypothetical protein